MSSPPPPPAPQLSDQMEFPLDDNWDFQNLLSFQFDDLIWNPNELLLPPESDNPPLAPIPESSDRSDLGGSEGGGSAEKIRKRDPRLICENFLAGRVPCACPEMDAKMAEEEEEEEGGGTKKRRTVKAKAVAVSIRCQVPECEADISELKGYHRRHRVCLTCVHASEVVLDGLPKRYCQQCGKFHTLPDFDEGKRSCRRKLERHNKRRRRKPTNIGAVVEKKTQADELSKDIAFDDKAGKDISCLSNQIVDEAVESEDGCLSPLRSHPSSQNAQSDSVISVVTSGEALQQKVEKDSLKCALSSSFGDNKNSYISACPTGRISFKLYDWNPAEFPRRLRHQIFQWLDSMPVELEGYIRPGCTILTIFMAMPWFMWDKLSEDASSYLHDFVSTPGSMLHGRGPMVVYLNDMVFRIIKGGTSLMNVKMEMPPPRLHYVHPTCFEAGKPMEFVLCGSNLLHSKCSFLISFEGRYLAYDYCLPIPHKRTGFLSGTKDNSTQSCEHQMYKIYIPHTDPKLFGPVFVEVENERGISNFIAVLIGDRHVCSEMQIMQQRFDTSLSSKKETESKSCEALVLGQAASSELILDVAWLLKEPQFEDMQTLLTSMQIQRFNCLLNFLIQNHSTIVLDKILHSLKNITDAERLYKLAIETNDADLSLFEKHVECAREIVRQKCKDVTELEMHAEIFVAKEDPSSDKYGDGEMLHLPTTGPGKGISKEDMFGQATSNFETCESTPLINREVIVDVNYRPQLTKIWQQSTSGGIFSSKIMSSRPLVLVLVTAAVCFGVCAVVLHPNKVGGITVSIRRSLFGNFNS